MIKSLQWLLGKYRKPVELVALYASPHKMLFGLFVVLSVLGVLTESVGVFLLVPLLETMGRSNIFSNVALLGNISRLFDAFPADQRLIWAGAIMLVVVLLRGVLQFAQEYLGYAIPHRVDLSLRLRAFDELSRSSLQYIDTLGAGKISNQAVENPARVGIALRFAAMLISNIIVLLSYIVVLGVVTPYLCLAAGAYTIISTLMFKSVTSGWLHKVGQDLTDANQRFSQIFYELLNGSKLIRLAGASADVRRELSDVVGSLSRARDRTVAVENMTVPFFSVVGGTLICILVIIVGMMNSATAAQAVGVLVLFVVLLFRILAPLSIINIARNNVVIHLDAMENLKTFFAETEKARERDGTVSLPTFSDAIKLQNVSFAYLPAQPLVINAIDLDIPKGKMTAIIGASGSGKSTLINLITRLYRPSSGRVVIDRTPLDDLKIETWWRRISVVTQEVIIINDTIRANLCFGLKDPVEDAQLRNAAKMAAIDDWIDTLPEKYETILGDRGSRLSGGQRQRVALARAFLRQPEVIILDEATSALDTLTELAIQKQILSLDGSKTIIVVAHRLSTVRRAHQIILLDQGQIAEKGHHNELLAKRGLYWRMLQSQSLELIEDDADVVGGAQAS